VFDGQTPIDSKNRASRASRG